MATNSWLLVKTNELADDGMQERVQSERWRLPVGLGQGPELFREVKAELVAPGRGHALKLGPQMRCWHSVTFSPQNRSDAVSSCP